MDVSGLEAHSKVSVQTETLSTNGTGLYASMPPFLAVRTTLATRKATAKDTPIIGDLITRDLHFPKERRPADSALLAISVPGIAVYRASAFVGKGVELPAAVTDLNNLIESATGMSAWGLVRFRRVAVHAERARRSPG